MKHAHFHPTFGDSENQARLARWIRACVTLGMIAALGFATAMLVGGHSPRTASAAADGTSMSAPAGQPAQRGGVFVAYHLVY
jgi:hypothetical protein